MASSQLWWDRYGHTVQSAYQSLRLMAYVYSKPNLRLELIINNDGGNKQINPVVFCMNFISPKFKDDLSSHHIDHTLNQ